MPTIVGIAGSLRKGSYNASLLRAAAELAPATVRFEIASIRGIPLYDGDVEAESGIPDAVKELKDKLAGADGFFLATPEYNSSVPGVLKNAIDWLSRPAADIPRVFGGLPVAILGASPGRFGTLLSQTAWLPILRALEMRIWNGPRLAVGGASKVFDESGKLVDDGIRKHLGGFVEGFCAHVAETRRR